MGESWATLRETQKRSAFLANFRLGFLELFLGLPFVARAVLVNQLPDAVILLDNRGTIVDLNPTTLRVLGRPSSQVVGRPIEEILPPATNLEFVESIHLPSHSEVSLGPEEAIRSYGLLVAPQHLAGDYLVGWTLILRGVTAYN